MCSACRCENRCAF